MSRAKSAHAVSDPQLRRWFLEYQRKYFPSVPVNTAVFWEPPNGKLGDCSRDDNGDFTIRIDTALRFSSAIARLILLHELAHANIWNKEKVEHGSAFHHELDRLYKAGAFKHLL